MENEISLEDAKWMVDDSGRTADNFFTLRYYVLRFKDVPSVIYYSGPNIEAVALFKELSQKMDAQEVHTQASFLNINREMTIRYTLTFPNQPYILHASGINTVAKDELDMPSFMENALDTNVYVSQFQLLRPSEASGKRDSKFEKKLNKYIEKCTLSKKPDKPFIFMIEANVNGFVMKQHAVDDNFEIKTLDLNYGFGFEKFHNQLMERFNNSSKGLVLFHGQPGTGKTYYIRHLLRKMATGKKIVIYMPPNMVDHLVEPTFMTFLVANIKHWSSTGNFCVLLIEDAEPLLAKRQEGVRIQGVTNLLNMTDGLLNDMLNLQIICTFNVDLRKLDSALLRPGRLIARKEFKALSELDANILAQRLGIKYHFKKGATLGEIYAKQTDNNTLIHDVEPDKDASTNIDDLM